MINFVRRLSSSASSHKNCHHFKQYIQLTDGSLSFVSSLSPQRPFVKLNIDSLSHPSWNLKLRDKLLLDDHGEVARFKKRFAGFEEDMSMVAQQFSGETRKLNSQTAVSSKFKGKGKKK